MKKMFYSVGFNDNLENIIVLDDAYIACKFFNSLCLTYL